MKFTTNDKLITCILPKGRAISIVKLLHDEKGIDSANVASGRGIGMVESISYGLWSEVDILTVTVDVDQADDVFAFIYDKADIDKVGRGFMFQNGLTRSTPFTLPDVPSQSQA